MKLSMWMIANRLSSLDIELDIREDAAGNPEQRQTRLCHQLCLGLRGERLYRVQRRR